MNLTNLRAMVASYEAWAKSLCAPVFWQNHDGDMRNGTMTFVQSESELLGITNAHVADGLKDCKDEIGKRCQIGGAYLDPARLIAKHPNLDLASFRLSSVLMGQIGFLADLTTDKTKQHEATTVPNWPPSSPSEGAPVMFGGYPALYRQSHSNGNVEFKFAWFAANVQSTSDRNVGMVLQIDRSISVSPIRIPSHADLGGWSGGPVFRVVESGLIERLELSAIIYQYSESTEIALAHPLTSLQPDGSFSRDPVT